jgi:hypothetical protein
MGWDGSAEKNQSKQGFLKNISGHSIGCNHIGY